MISRLSILVLFYFNSLNALSFLGIFPVPYKSHYMVFKPLLYELASRGHDITIIGQFPDYENKNIKYIDVSTNQTDWPVTKDLNEFESVPSLLHNIATVFKVIVNIPIFATKRCQSLINNEQIKLLLKTNITYDAVFVEQFTNDCDLGVAYHFNAPIIAMTSHVLFPWSYSRLGIPFDPANDPFYFSTAGINPGLLRKLEIIVLNSLINTVPRWISQYQLRKVLQKQIPEVPPLEDIANNISLTLVFQHYALTGHRLLTSRVIEVGGLHIGEIKPLDAELANFVNDAEHGVIYMSFGSMVQAVTMSEQKRKSFLQAFQKLPQKVIWKWENGSMSDAPSNVLVRRWAPQLDLLCHPRVVAFISHGGMLSSSEAVHCGVPTLAVPFYGDQMANAASIRDSGLGNLLLYQDITTDQLLQMLTDLLSTRRRSQAAAVSRMWRNRPLPPLELAARWSELAAQGFLPPIETTPARDRSVSLDMASAAVLAFILLVIFYIPPMVKDFISRQIFAKIKAD